MALMNPTSTHQWATYLDFTEVWEYLQEDKAPTGAEQNKLQRYIDAACAEAQGPGGANRPLAPTRIKERHDGWSGEYIMLLYSPVLQLVSCSEWQSSGGTVTLPNRRRIPSRASRSSTGRAA